MKILKIIPDTIADGPGLRTSIYFAGCSHHCKGCHNQESWDFNQGKDYNRDQLINEITNIDKVTLTGGDPLCQLSNFQSKLSELSDFVYHLKVSYNSNIWLYTGYTFEFLLEKYSCSDPSDKWFFFLSEILDHIDIIVDGKFIESLRDTTLKFRGSSNQRIIDVPKSINQNKVILWNESNSISTDS